MDKISSNDTLCTVKLKEVVIIRMLYVKDTLTLLWLMAHRGQGEVILTGLGLDTPWPLTTFWRPIF